MADLSKQNSKVNVAETQKARDIPADLKQDLTAASILDDALAEAGFSEADALADAEDDSDVEIPEDPTAEGGAGRSTPEAGARQTG